MKPEPEPEDHQIYFNGGDSYNFTIAVSELENATSYATRYTIRVSYGDDWVAPSTYGVNRNESQYPSEDFQVGFEGENIYFYCKTQIEKGQLELPIVINFRDHYDWSTKYSTTRTIHITNAGRSYPA